MAYMELKNVSYIYPNGCKAVSDLSLEINKGERIAIIGENGAGKTTVAKLMNGLKKPSDGDVIIDGWNTKDFSTAKISRKVGYVFQNPDDQIFLNTVHGEIAFGPRNLNLSKDAIMQNVSFAAKLTKMEHLLNENPYDLPLAARKFLCIASVLAMNPNIIILDEPTAGQSKEGLDCLADIIRELSNQQKIVITITHDMEFVAKNFKRTIVMAHSNKIADGSTQEIFYEPDILQEAGLKPPYITELAIEFKFKEKILDITDFICYVKKNYL